MTIKFNTILWLVLIWIKGCAKILQILVQKLISNLSYIVVKNSGSIWATSSTPFPQPTHRHHNVEFYFPEYKDKPRNH